MLSLKSLFGRGGGDASSDVAKERLRKVLVQDRANISPQFIASVQANVTRALAEYMDIDTENSSVTIDHSGRNISLVANIPIQRIKRNPGKK